MDISSCLRHSILSILLLLSVSAMGDEITEVREDLFHIDLPGEWIPIDPPLENNIWIYESVNGDERMTVSIFIAGPDYDKTNLSHMFDEFVEIRRQSELEAGGSGTELSDLGSKTLPSAVVGRYQGSDPRGRRFSNFVVANRTGIANFYFEAVGMSEAEFADRYPIVLGKVGFVESET